jgi:alkylhydroperoxidase/carboxymuconolactone decarboxylase family protein YurZ
MQSDPIDNELEQSFPASDPPDWTGTHAGAPRDDRRDGAAQGRAVRGPDLLVTAGAVRDRALAPGPLDPKTLELIAFATQIGRAEEGARAHAAAARRNGASIDELRHALAVAVVSGGFGALDVGVRILNDLP